MDPEEERKFRDTKFEKFCYHNHVPDRVEKVVRDEEEARKLDGKDPLTLEEIEELKANAKKAFTFRYTNESYVNKKLAAEIKRLERDGTVDREDISMLRSKLRAVGTMHQTDLEKEKKKLSAEGDGGGEELLELYDGARLSDLHRFHARFNVLRDKIRLEVKKGRGHN